MQLCEAFDPPRPLLEYRPEPLAYPVEALGEILGPAVERMAEVIGVPRAMAAQSVLATAALVSQGHANVHLDGRTYPLSLYLLTVASSGDRKSAVDHLALTATRNWEREQWTLYMEQLNAYRAAVRVTARVRKHGKLEDREPAEPVPPRLIISEPTIEALIKNLCHGLPSMGLFNDEGGQFLGSSTMSKENQLKAISTLSSLWDGSPIDRTRSMPGESLRAYDRRLSLHLMLQPYLANQLLRDPVINGQGILGRCLVSWPERLAGRRLYKAVDLTRDARVQRYQARITALLQKPLPLHKDGSLNPVALELTASARTAWIDIHDTIECQSGEFGELAGIQSVAGKAAANVLRIAGVLAVIEDASSLGEAHIERASTLMDYYLAEIQRLTEQEPINTRREEADRLLRWLTQKGWTHFTIRDLNRNGPRFARKSSHQTATLLVELITFNWLNSSDGKTFEVRHVPPQ
ncbi:YfjI family protein [Pseudomonas sp. MWU12-2037]|uniref:YfjI family protein n=1 Tax=Pseudomonas sp. MWU12-2037 TaxID=2928690 RepID=UPI00200DEC8A|nr:YfjI family protein [Pseudomonas sp. MWU12-2037]